MHGGIITIFGGSGFLGRHLVGNLAKKGHRIRIATRRPQRAAYLQTLGDVGQVVSVRADLLDHSSVVRAVDGADRVINLVGTFGRGAYGFDVIQAEGASRVANAAAEVGAQALVHLSSIGADAGSPSHYSRSKAAGELAVTRVFPRSTILRPSIVFGAEDAFFNRFAAMARYVPALPLFGNTPQTAGTTRFQPVFVQDVASAIVESLAAQETAGRIYELGGPRIYSWRELMELVVAFTGRRRLLLPVPFSVASALAVFLEFLPAAPLTRDQVKQLRIDNIVQETALSLSDLGIEPTPVETILPVYLSRFRKDSALFPA